MNYEAQNHQKNKNILRIMEGSDVKILIKMAQKSWKTGNTKEILKIIKNTWGSFLKSSYES